MNNKRGYKLNLSDEDRKIKSESMKQNKVWTLLTDEQKNLRKENHRKAMDRRIGTRIYLKCQKVLKNISKKTQILEN